jgi:glycosyltransferase involved in cell wall biosynthesis
MSYKQNKLPLVSIITPTYNRADYLEDVIKSVLSQDYPNIEYIVLDDGSTDNTRQLLEKHTGRIIWESHSNMGETLTNNKGWAMANGEIVATVNSDDPLLPGAVKISIEYMQSHPNLLVAYPNWKMIGAQGELIANMDLPEYDYLYMLRRHHCSVGPGAFIRRTAFGLVGMRDPNFRYVADFEYWLRLGMQGPFGRIPHRLATFRVHPNSTSINQRGELIAREHIKLMDKIYSLPSINNNMLKYKAEAYSSAYYIAGIVGGSKNSSLRYKYFCISLKFMPTMPFRYYKRLIVFIKTFISRLLYVLIKKQHPELLI